MVNITRWCRGHQDVEVITKYRDSSLLLIMKKEGKTIDHIVTYHQMAMGATDMVFLTLDNMYDILENSHAEDKR